MRAYSMDLRQRVLAACDGGMGTTAVAGTFAVSPAWVRRLKQRRRAGEVGPRRPAHPGPAPARAAHAGRLRELVRDHPGLTAAEYRDRLGVDVAALTVWRALRRLGLTYKKSRSRRPSKAARMSPRRGSPGGPS
jgi:transposase